MRLLPHLKELRLPALPDLGVWLLCALLLLPVGTVLASLFTPDEAGTMAHLVNTVLDRYIINALLLLAGVAGLSFLIGTSTAWVVTHYEFPLRRILSPALMLPLAMPAYVLALLYGHWLDVPGPVQTALRSFTDVNVGEYWFLTIRSLGGVIVILALASYAYVYMLARLAFQQQSTQMIDSALMLGASGPQLFWRLGLPVARPAIIVALALVGMETLADFGTVSLYGVESFTTGIYRSWFGMGDMSAAAKLSAILLLFVMGVLALERYSRGKAQFYNSNAVYSPIERVPLSGFKGMATTFLCAIPVILGFLLPLLQLLSWAFLREGFFSDTKTWMALWNVVLIATPSVLIALCIALYFAETLRQKPHRALAATIRTASSGYAIPGTVIAVGVMIPLLAADKSINALATDMGFSQPGLILSGSIVAVIFACVVRFLAVALSNTESALGSITPMMDDISTTLGTSRLHMIRRIHLPMIRGGLMLAALMVFIDIVKELPATLLLRPFNFDTLAIRTYELAKDEQLIAASAPALMMVLLCLPVVLLLARQFEKSRPTGRH